MMVYSFVFVYFAPVLLAEELLQIIQQFVNRGIQKCIISVITVVFMLLSIVSANYIYLDNVNYTSMYYTTK